MLVFVKRRIWSSDGARCCQDHLYKRQLSFDCLNGILADKTDHLVCDAQHIQQILDDFQLVLDDKKTFDFDAPHSLDNEDYYNITGLQKGIADINTIFTL